MIYILEKPVKGLILKAGYSSMGSLMFEHEIIPFLPLLAPLKHIPILESKL
jgi:abhydrolase domain-containing protein 12